MQTIAPGKVMIAGEYSVLLGHPAIVAAINREARCSFEPSSQLKFYTKTSDTVFSNENSGLFNAVVKTLDRHSLSTPVGHYVLDTSDFFDERHQKIGLGSSAAGVVALTKNILGHQGLKNPLQLFQLSHEAHKLFSGGMGSGADIAASIYGGVIGYQYIHNAPLVQDVDLRKIWPHLLIIHSGKPQSTKHFVEQFLKSKEHASIIDNFNKETNKQTERLLANLGEIDVFIEVLNHLFGLMEHLGNAIGIDIVSEEHRHIQRIAQSLNGAAKPSGAGGGDIAIALVPEENRAAFVDELGKSNFSILPLELAF